MPKSRLAIPLVLISLFVLPATASATVFTVDDTGNANDANVTEGSPLNGDCDVVQGTENDCTLTAAIQEANSSPGPDTIVFNKSLLDDITPPAKDDADDALFTPGAAPGSVTLNGSFPAIIDGLAIDAGNCSPSPFDSSAPCVVLRDSLFVNVAASRPQGEVSINGVAMSTNNVAAIEVTQAKGDLANTPDFRLTGSWFGIDTLGGKLDPVPSIDVQLGDVDGAVIGGDPIFGGPNVFARHNAAAVYVRGADNTEISRNTFGVMPDGTFARFGEGASNNGDNIEVVGDSIPNPDDQATGTVIGGTAAGPALTSAACDGPCNLISKAGISATNIPQNREGIDLVAEDGESEIPANGTVVRGNVIDDNPVEIGTTDNITVGGPVDGQGNSFSDRAELSALTGSTGLLVQRNLIGLNFAGVQVNGTANLAGQGQVLDNRFAAVTNDVALTLGGTDGYVVRGNVFGERLDGAAANAGSRSIQVSGSNHVIGGAGAGQGNRFTTTVPTNSGLGITGDGNTVEGNVFGIGSGGQARPMRNAISLDTDADGNRIGGDSAGSENVMANITEDAIRVNGANSDGNEIARNRGSANGATAADIFIDLGNDGAGNQAEPAGPNAGAQAPAITAITGTSASGTAPAGSTVRVFSKATSSAGDVEGFLGQGTADGAGNWQASFPQQPAGKLVAATQTTASSTSELSANATIPAVPPATDTDPPETTISKAPKNKIKSKRATYRFTADEPGSTFACKVDKKAFAPCTSPLKLKKLKATKHRFQVIATDAAGNADPTSARDSFKKVG